ncbi:hypothetical protein C8R44DRAFT_892505 [Mycena epipterygia]|nr:hypothetical protein C8R44DRAFT_892505 [Mycena epipterygia]
MRTCLIRVLLRRVSLSSFYRVRQGFAQGCPPRSAPRAPPPLPPPPLPPPPRPLRLPNRLRPRPRLRQIPLPRSAPTSPTVPATPISKLPRFLQSPAQRDRSKPLSVDRPPSTASSASSHPASAFTSPSSGGDRRFLGLGKDSCQRERAQQHVELLTLHKGGHTANGSDDFDFDGGRPTAVFVLPILAALVFSMHIPPPNPPIRTTRISQTTSQTRMTEASRTRVHDPRASARTFTLRYGAQGSSPCDLPSLASLPPPLFVAASNHPNSSRKLPLSPSQSDGSVSSASSYGSASHSHQGEGAGGAAGGAL